MLKEYLGGCSCKAVRYKCSAKPLATFICHCNDCQKSSGAPFTTLLFVPQTSVMITGELRGFFLTGGSGKPVTRKFCRNCGSQVVANTKALPHLAAISAGTLDDSSWFQPDGHCWTTHKQAWLQLNDGLPRYERAPKF